MRRLGLVGCAVLVVAAWVVSGASARTEHYEVTVSVSGPGHVTAGAPDPTSGSIDCPDNCSALVKQNTTIELVATPDDGDVFSGWGAECGQYGTDTTCYLLISGPKSVTAGFGTPPPPVVKFTLSVTKAGSGTGYVGGAGGIDCGPTCSATLQQGSAMSLLAVADNGSTFAGWSGAGCSGTAMCAVTFDVDKQVVATFDHVDRTPPNIRTVSARAAPGSAATLRYRVFDDSGESRELLTIMRGKTTIGRVSVPLGRVLYRHVYSARWRVPKSLATGQLLYCAVATDRAGNRSKRSCSAFIVT
ncbi:MAG TPA: hypothetical protein VLJ76_06600 [Gaiellaceae bacterium]|nr:hypothetical protein [Gaiellaceae bacterium]